mmetsp:Transcript_20409/g.60851  ORF Transcript_20409/g.60851 Transcript_20409/m.60851 type:complete len:225 (+) Transcript_20409:569-1243(+)
MRFSKRRRMAGSSSQGMFVAPSTSRPSVRVATPCICTRNSVLMRRVASDSPSDREPHMESISSMKMMACSSLRAIWKRFFTRRSLSPCHLLTRSELETAKNCASASVATALARYDLPVPGGPYSRMPRQGWRLPTKSCGKRRGRMTVSFSASLAPSRPATSLHLTFGFSVTMADDSEAFSLAASSSSPSLSFLSLVPAPPEPCGLFFAFRCCSITVFKSSARFM